MPPIQELPWSVGEAPANDSGFTLIELLVVIAILGILAGTVVFAVQNWTGTSVAAACDSDLKVVRNAVNTYRAQMGNYPEGVGGVNSPGFRTDSDPVTDGTPTDPNQGQIVNAAGMLSGPQSNALGSELLTGSMSETNNGFDQSGNPTRNVPINPSRGPWLKELPNNGSSYYIWVANDGTGTILVGTGSNYGHEPSSNNIDCAAAGVG